MLLAKKRNEGLIPTPEITSKDGSRVAIAMTYGGKKTTRKPKKTVPLNKEEQRRKKSQKKGGGQSRQDDVSVEVQEEEIRHSVQTDPLAGKVREPLSDPECGAMNAWYAPA